MKLKFSKMHGLGNDFVVINGFQQSTEKIREQAKLLCDRRFGIGCDQLLVLKPSEIADFKMEIFNADGGEVEMCGNGIRCVALYAKKHQIVSHDAMHVETLAGIIKPKIIGELVEVDMGEPILEGSKIPVQLEGMVVAKSVEFANQSYSITCVSMGNPHCVIFVDSLENHPVKEIGPIIENHVLFPRRTNVPFVQVLDKNHIQVRVWERGAGETLACGTGACAAGVASVLNGKTHRKLSVTLLGGDLSIHWSEQDNHVYMTGPGSLVFDGEIEL